MKTLISSVVILAILNFSNGGPLRLQKRAAFYIANETACVVDNTVYSNGDPIPTDDPCEACKCRPPGFACVLKDCEAKPGCRAVRRAGHCCPDYICGCEHNGRMFRDGDEIRDSQNPCYTCHCQGSSIACAFVDCFFRVDCAPEYVPGECCPHYTNCNDTANVPFVGNNPYLIDKESSRESTFSPSSEIVPGVTYVQETTQPPNPETTIIEIFELETKKPELLQLDPETIDLSSAKVEESRPGAEDDKHDTSFETLENVEEESNAEEHEKLKESSEEINVDQEVKNKHEIFKSEAEVISEETSGENQSSEIQTEPTLSSKETQKINVEHTTEIHSPLVVENINVEPQEPSNTLESDSLSPEYGKSLRFPDQDKSVNETELKATEEQKVTTVQSQEASEESKIESSNPSPAPEKSQALTETTLTDLSPTEDNSKVETDSHDKTLHYNANESLQTNKVETETTIIDIKEQTSTSSAAEAESISPVFSTAVENLFKSSNDKLEIVDEDKINVLHSTSMPSTQTDTESTTVEKAETVDQLTSKKTDEYTASELGENEKTDISITSTTHSQIDVSTKENSNESSSLTT